MRLLLINYEYPPLGGGGGNATGHLAREFARSGHVVTVLTSAWRGLPPRQDSEGVSIIRMPAGRTSPAVCPPLELLAFVISGLARATALTARSRPDVILAFFGFPSGPVAWRVARSLRVPYVLSLRGSDVPRPEIRGREHLEVLMRPALRFVWRRAAALTAVSEGLKAAAEANGAPANIRVIGNGVDCDRFHPDEGAHGRGLRLLYAGRLQRFKGVHHLIRAVARVRRTAKAPIALEIAGEGPERACLEGLASGVGLSDVVEFSGWVAREEMPRVYRRADLFVLPSYVEGMPNVVLEAMASGLPVIGTDVPGTREVIMDGVNGYLAPPKDEGALAERIAFMAARPEERRRMATAARAQAKKFSWKRIADRYLELLAEVAR